VVVKARFVRLGGKRTDAEPRTFVTFSETGLRAKVSGARSILPSSITPMAKRFSNAAPAIATSSGSLSQRRMAPNIPT
jgi:hypothetical protein